ncbi:MAG TPA: hypothetical protein DCQ92_02105 [Verrucomicrobia subdivision 3 bacterium]|nr:hypothetical protein [Limisphaerales bacterium]
MIKFRTNEKAVKIFGRDIKSERCQRQIGYLALAAGLIAVAGGLFGLWIQGRTMYEGTSLHMIADVLCPGDIYLTICSTTLVISTGSLLLSWVILASKLTEKISATKRNVLFAAVAVVFLIAVMIVSKIAADQDWARASAAADEYFKNLQTNAPTSSPVKTQKARQ